MFSTRVDSETGYLVGGNTTRRLAEHAAPTGERVGMTTDSPMRFWIRFWLKRNDHEFEEEAEPQRELDQVVIQKGVSPSVLE